jgi:hypothetical protein
VYTTKLKTNLSGCSDSAAVSFVIFTGEVPVVELMHDGEDEYLCPGEMATLTGTEGLAIQWYLNGEAIDGEISESIEIALPGIYNQYITNEDGCSDSAAVGITFLPGELPLVLLESDGDDEVLCPGEFATITGNDELEMQWYLNGVAIDGEEGESIVIDAPGTYNQYTTNGFGCSDSAAVGITFTAGELPEVEITNVDNIVLICPGDVITLDGTAGEFMQWYKDGAEIPGETGVTFDVTLPGSYNQLVTNVDGCSNDADEDYVIELDEDCDVSIDEIDKVAVQVYPNPVQDILNIMSDALISQVTVFDLSGKIILDLAQLSTNTIQLNYADLAKGTYMVKVVTNEGTRMMKTQK